jgi:flagellar motor switch protein FliG
MSEQTKNRPAAGGAKPAGGALEGSGLRKAAIFLRALEMDMASQIMSKLDLETIELVSKEIAKLSDVKPEEQQGVLDEFRQMGKAHEYILEGGIEYARGLLEKSLPPDKAMKILQAVQQAIQVTPFSFLQKAETENVLTFIQDEHPQTISLILSHLPTHKAAEVLAGLPAKKQVEVVKRIANMEHANPEVVKEVERTLEHRLASVVAQEFEDVGGVQNVASILNLTDRATEKGILEALEEDQPDLVERIRRLMFVFEDILLVNDRGIQKVMKEVDNDELALALKGASEQLREKIFRNMSERAAAMIKEELEYMGPVRVSDVEAAQQRIVDVLRKLEDAGEVVIQGRGGEEQVIV